MMWVAWLAPFLLMQAETFPVSGTVVHAVTGAPVGGVRVGLGTREPNKEIAQMTTGADGAFWFRVAAGKYSVMADKPGFVLQWYGEKSFYSGYHSAVVAGAGESTENLVFRLIPSAVITGKVTDEQNEPLAGMTVLAYRISGRGEEQSLRAAGRVTTNDLGEYRLHSLARGQYVVAATGSVHQGQDLFDASGQKAGFAPAFHPGVSSAANAAVVSLQPGAQARADIRQRLVRTVTVQAKLATAGANGRSYAYLSTPLGNSGHIWIGEAVSFLGGVATLPNAPQGSFELLVHDGPQRLIARKAVRVEADPTEVVVAETPPARVKIRVEFAGKPPAAGAVLILAEESGRFRYPKVPDEQGTVEFGEIPAGRYRMSMYAGRNQVALLSAASDQARVQGDGLVIPETGQVMVRLVADAGAAELRGKAYQDGRPQAGLIVALIPRESGNQLARYRFDQTDSDGSFTWRGVAPGEYLAFAFASGEIGDYQDEAVMEKLRGKGKVVVVKAGENGAVRLEVGVLD